MYVAREALVLFAGANPPATREALTMMRGLASAPQGSHESMQGYLSMLGSGAIGHMLTGDRFVISAIADIPGSNESWMYVENFTTPKFGDGWALSGNIALIASPSKAPAKQRSASSGSTPAPLP